MSNGEGIVPSSSKKRIKYSKAGKPSSHKYLQISEMQIDENVYNPSILDDPVVLPSKRVLDAIGERQYMRKRNEVIIELENVKFRMNKILSGLQLLEKDDYLEVLKSLYEATGEVPPRFIMLHMGLDFLPSTVPPDEVRVVTQMLSSPENRRGVTTDREILNQCFQEIWRLRYQRKYEVLQSLSDAKDRKDFQFNLLIQLSNWLRNQHETMCDSLNLACGDNEIPKLEDALETQLHLCVKFMITAFHKTRKASDELLDRFRLLTTESQSMEDIFKPSHQPPSANDVKKFDIIPVKTLLKKKNKWDWASTKSTDLLILAAIHTKSPILHNAVVKGIALYNNMMKAAKARLDALPAEEEAIRKLNKKLEEKTEQMAMDKRLLHNAIEVNKNLNTQCEQLKKANIDAQEKCEQLREKIRLLGGSLPTAKQETVKMQSKATVEKIQKMEAPVQKRENLTTKDPKEDKLIDSALRHLQESETLKRELIELSKGLANKLMQMNSAKLKQLETMQTDLLSQDLLSMPTQSNEETRDSVIKRLRKSTCDLEGFLKNLIEGIRDLEDNINAPKVFVPEPEDDKKRKKARSTKERMKPEPQLSGKEDSETPSKTARSQLTPSPSYSEKTVPAQSQHFQWMETVRSDCIETLKALSQFASGMFSMLSDFNAKALARGMQKANTKIIRLQLHRQTVIRDISATVNEFFSEVKAIVTKVFLGIQSHGAEMVSQQLREEKYQTTMNDMVKYKSKNVNLEEQYKALFFMHMRLCEVARELKAEEMATDVNQKMEKWLSLEEGQFENDLCITGRQVKTNWQMLIEAYFQKKLSQKCVQAGYHAFQEIFDIFDEKMACLVKLYYLKSQLPEIDGLLAKMRKNFSKDISRQFYFEMYRQTRYNRVMDKINAVKSRMQELQSAKREQMYNVWMVINQILLETGILLICPRPKGMINMEKYDKIFIKEETVRQESEARLLDIPVQSLPPFSITLQALKAVIKKRYVPLVSPENIQDILNQNKHFSGAADTIHPTTLSLEKKTAEAFIPQGFAYNPMDDDNAEFLRWQQSAKRSAAHKEEADAKTNDREQIKRPSEVSMYDI